MTKRAVAAVVVNYNGGDAVLACVASLLDEAEDVVVVDNASADGSAEAVERTFGERVRVERMRANVGVSRARNAGARLTAAPYLLFLDNDAVALPGMAAALYDACESDPLVGIAGPVVLDARADDVVQTTGLTIDRWGFAADPTIGMRVHDLPENQTRDIFFVQGCAVMVRAGVFAAIGGFDEGIFFGCEDTDLCWRAWLAGYHVASVRDALCRHAGGGSLGTETVLYTPVLRVGAYRTSPQRITARESNTFRMMVTNLGVANLALYLCAYFPVVALEALTLFVAGRWRVAGAYVAAFVRMGTSLPATLRRRRVVQRSRRVADAAITRMWSRGYEKLRFLRQNGIPRMLP